MGESFSKSDKLLYKMLNVITFGIFSRLNRKTKTQIDTIPERDEFFDDAEKANQLCEELVDSGKKKIGLLKELQQLTKKENELEKFKLLTAEDLKRIRKLVFDHKAIVEEKEAIKGRLISKNRILSKIQKYEEEVPKLLQEIEEAEDKQRRVKRDVDYLEGEKEALIYSKEQLENAQVIINRISVGAIIIFAIVALIFSSLIMNGNTRIFIPSSITTILAVIIGTWLYIFRRQVNYEIKRNGRMQVRAVKLLNKAKIRYVYYTGFLDYEYTKFNVDSLEQLERNWELYNKNKHHEKRYNNINAAMSKIEDEVLRILNKRGIHVNFFSDIKNWTRIEERKKLLMDIQKEKGNIESKLDVLEAYQEDIWSQLNELKENDETEDKMIEKIINNYLEDI